LKTPAALFAFAVATFATVTHADTEQNNQVMFGVTGAYEPAQNRLSAGDLTAIGHYVSYAHELDMFYVGGRVTLSYAWFPNGAAGQQYWFEPAAFVGLRIPIGKRFAVRFEVGTGLFVNGGEGFSSGVIDRTTLHAAFQATIVKTFTLEAFGGPTFLIGQSNAAVIPELALGAGWRF